MTAFLITLLSVAALLFSAALYAGLMISVYALLDALLRSEQRDREWLIKRGPTMTLSADGHELREWARQTSARDGRPSRGQTAASPVLVVLIKSPSHTGPRANHTAEVQP